MKLLMLLSLVALCALTVSGAPYFDDDGEVPEGLGKRAAAPLFGPEKRAAGSYWEDFEREHGKFLKREAPSSAQPYKRSAFDPVGFAFGG